MFYINIGSQYFFQFAVYFENNKINFKLVYNFKETIANVQSSFYKILICYHENWN